MRDVIGRVIEAETGAKRILATAQADADRILADAKKSAAERAALIDQDTKLQGEQLIETTLQAARQEKEARLVKITDDLKTQTRLDDSARQHAIEFAIRRVTS